MFIDFMLNTFKEYSNQDALVWRDTAYSYAWLTERVRHWRRRLNRENVGLGTVVALEADFSPNSVALLLSLIETGAIIVPLTNSVESKKSDFMRIAQCEVSVVLNTNDAPDISRSSNSANHELYQQLRTRKHPGLVLFSSGSTGESKAAVHDIVAILEKFRVPRHAFKTISFLLYDHIGGLNTLFYTLSNAGCLVTVQERNPDGVLRAIEKYRVELLPTSPTFINLILLSEAYKRYNLSSLKLITYGTEPMPESTLRRFHELLPKIRLLQTYGLSEVGILRSKSKSSDSLWVKVGGEGFETRVVDGILQIKAQSAMLGYLNAPSPFTENGWFDTGDSVEVDGDYFRILGRESEIINVGGEKVYPAEVESVIQEIDNVAEVTVYGEKNPIIGNIVCAKVNLVGTTDERSFIRNLKNYCSSRLERFKVPIKIIITQQDQYSHRFKKIRDIKNNTDRKKHIS